MIAFPSGWRAFAVDGATLLPAFARRYWSTKLDLDRDAWRPGHNVARCLVEDHKAPADGCTCGFRVNADVTEELGHIRGIEWALAVRSGGGETGTRREAVSAERGWSR